ncbi:hypothetical protein CQW23_25584 [Capsicum baccatum]|uniref:TF-B3 domain-containing protein n=1 Tax=Capsicum baccatum TaxID=33114 RepID=A0A2G2VLC7_CAPBA|nr:hypothetical protein CQW23_25584 [Capsicum baccatum]
MDFAKSNGWMNRKCEMILKDEAERCWSVWIGRMGHNFGITRGWTNFRVEKGLQVGDAYKFELIKNGKVPIAYFHYVFVPMDYPDFGEVVCSQVSQKTPPSSPPSAEPGGLSRHHVHDVIYYDDGYYVVASDGSIFSFDKMTLDLKEISGPAPVRYSDDFDTKFHLIKTTTNELLMIHISNPNHIFIIKCEDLQDVSPILCTIQVRDIKNYDVPSRWQLLHPIFFPDIKFS